MQTWNLDAMDLSEMPTDAGLVLAGLVSSLASRSDAPRRVLSFARSDDEWDVDRYRALVELAPGVILQTCYGSPDALDDGREDEYDEGQAIAWMAESVERCSGLGWEKLASSLHEIRREARRLISEWAIQGAATRLEDVQIAPVETWRFASVPSYAVLLGTLDDRLKPGIEVIAVDAPDGVAAALAKPKRELSRRLGRLAGLGAQGADASIDQLALNAIELHHDVAETLRRFAAETRIWLADGTCLIMEDGHVYAGTSDPAADWQLHRDTATVFSRTLPLSLCAEAGGLPVTALLDHPLLSADMEITECSRSRDDEETPWLTVRFDQPSHLFCTASGRTWPASREGEPTAGP